MKDMQTHKFIKMNERLPDSLDVINPKFVTLKSLLRTDVSLSEEEVVFCEETYCLKNPLSIVYQPDEEFKSFDHLLEENIRELLHRNCENYIQCIGHQFKDFTLTLKTLNFGKTILECSLFRNLFSKLDKIKMFKLFSNYSILVKYKGEYVQVTGKPLTETFNLKALGGQKMQKRKKKLESKMSIQGQNDKISKQRYIYSEQAIDRFQMFYCTHMNRHSGMFCKNIFFQKGLIKSNYKFQTTMLVKDCLKKNILNKIQIKEDKLQILQELFLKMFEKLRDLLYYRMFNGKFTSQFDYLLSKYCRLPKNYYEIKRKTKDYIKKGSTSVQSQELFDILYSSYSKYEQVSSLINFILTEIVPQDLIGKQNLAIFKRMMVNFISMKRYQNYKIIDFLYEMDVFKIPWLNLKFNKTYKRQIITQGRRHLAPILIFLINQVVVQIVKANFYITEKHKQANKLFYYRKPIWSIISMLAIKKFSDDNLQKIDFQKCIQMRKSSSISYPQGKLRILPKKGTFRPIITFNRKLKVEADSSIRAKATLNQLLSDTQLVLRNMKNILGEEMGYCIFDNTQIMRKYDAFVKKWRSMGSPKLCYFTLDIKKCYDSIDTSKLIKIIESTKYIQDYYYIEKYNRLYRNKRPLNKTKRFSQYFNMKERVTACSLYNDPMEIKNQQNIPSINIFSGKQRGITRRAIIQKLKLLCQGSIISYRKNFWLQKVGIPQGLNVSGVLCSLYFATLQKEYLEINDGLLMRLTDDYLYIGPEEQAIKVIDSLLKCAKQNGFNFNQDKIAKNFYHPRMEKVTPGDEFIWIGKRININTLQIHPFFQITEKTAFAMNVNLNRTNLKSFLSNKLKSLLTNHFAAYFKPKLFPFSHVACNVRLFVRVSLEKFHPFLVDLQRLKIEKQDQFILKFFQQTFHDFIVYTCMLAQTNDQIFYDRIYIEVVDELLHYFKQKKKNHPQLKLTQKSFANRISQKRKKLLKFQQESKPSESQVV